MHDQTQATRKDNHGYKREQLSGAAPAMVFVVMRVLSAILSFKKPTPHLR